MLFFLKRISGCFATQLSASASSTSGIVEFSIKENTIFNVSSHTPSPQPTRVAEDLHDSLTKNGTFTFEILPSAFSLSG